MGLTDFFSRDARNLRALKKNMQQTINKHAQSVDRWRAMEALRDDGSEEAVVGLLRRFSMRYDKSIEDDDEKKWVYSTLVEMGAAILPALRRYMRETETLAWSLKVLEKVTKDEQFLQVIEELCEHNDNTYVRDPSKKIQLIHFMGDHKDRALASLLLPYLEDVDEGVRFTAVESVLKQDVQDLALGPLLRLLQSPTEESRRVKVGIVRGLSAAGWPLPERTAEIERLIADLVPGARLDKERRVHAPEGE